MTRKRSRIRDTTRCKRNPRGRRTRVTRVRVETPKGTDLRRKEYDKTYRCRIGKKIKVEFRLEERCVGTMNRSE